MTQDAGHGLAKDDDDPPIKQEHKDHVKQAKEHDEADKGPKGKDK